MVPAAVVILAAFPLTPNGKIDRKALPLPLQLRHEPVAPRTATELALVQIWEALLGRPCGVTDDFFELGGHSLLAVTLVKRVRAVMGKELPLRALFEEATIERIAALLGTEESPLVRLNDRVRRPGEPLLVLIHPIGGDVFAYRRLASGADMPVVGLRALPSANGLSLEALAAHYVATLRVESSGPYVLAGWSLGGVVAFEMARQLDGEVAQVVLIDSWITTEVARGAGAITLRTFLADLASSLGRVLPDDVDTIEGAVVAATAAGIAVDAATLQQQFAIFQANGRRLSDYIPQPYGGRCLLVTTDERPRGWSDLVFELQTVQLAGDHYSLLTEQAGALLHLIQSSEEVSLAVDVP
jgi:thioesterase domain-containing protein